MEADKKIVVNGREYSGIEQMPPKIREQYLQAIAMMRSEADSSGTVAATQSGPNNVAVRQSIVFNGQKYNSLDELPPDVRQMIARMPPPAPGESKTLLEIKTSETFSPRLDISPHWKVDDAQPVEEDSNVAWLLVKMLVVVVLILLFLLFLAGRKHAGL